MDRVNIEFYNYFNITGDYNLWNGIFSIGVLDEDIIEIFDCKFLNSNSLPSISGTSFFQIIFTNKQGKSVIKVNNLYKL